MFKNKNFLATILLFMLFQGNAQANISRLVFKNPKDISAENYANIKKNFMFKRVNIGIKSNKKSVARNIKKNTLPFKINNTSSSTLFITKEFSEGDVVLLNYEEEREFELKNLSKTTIPFSKELLSPCIVFDKEDNARSFGYCFSDFNKAMFEEEDYEEATATEILSFDPEYINKDLTILYVILPKNRLSTGYIMIKTEGSFIIDTTGQELKIPVLGLSRRSLKNNNNNRIYSDSNTPQGIYRLNGVMVNEDNFQLGGVPYFNIDSNRPINSDALNTDSLITDNIVSKENNQQYWLYEYVMASAIGGRELFRIHGNSADPNYPPTWKDEKTGSFYRPNLGCLNMGNYMDQLLQIFINLDLVSIIFDRNMIVKSGKMIQWNTSENIGKIFIVVKDDEDLNI